MLSRRTVLVALGLLLMGAGTPLRAQERLKAVASFSILGDMVARVGGGRVQVTTLVGPDGDGHVYQPKPGDTKALSVAKVFIVNGLGFEGWQSRFVKSANFKGTVAVASRGVEARETEGGGHEGGKGDKAAHAHEAKDPHAWQSLANGRLYVQNIRDALIAADPEGRADYEANAARYTAEIEALDQEVRSRIAALPPERRKVITSHDAFGYFEQAYGLDFVAPSGVSTESEASARDVARIIRQIRDEKIPAVFVENVSDKRLLEQITRETGARIGGTLYSDALSGPTGPASTYLDMFRHNMGVLTEALQS